MPVACDEQKDNVSETASTVQSDTITSSAKTNGETNGHSAETSYFTEEDVDYDLPVKTKASNDAEESLDQNSGESFGYFPKDFCLVFQRTFNIKISAPGVEIFDLQVRIAFVCSIM